MIMVMMMLLYDDDDNDDIMLKVITLGLVEREGEIMMMISMVM